MIPIVANYGCYRDKKDDEIFLQVGCWIAQEESFNINFP